jgi:hypothetical protein
MAPFSVFPIHNSAFRIHHSPQPPAPNTQPLFFVSEEWVGKAPVLGRVLQKRSSALACYLAVSAFSTASGFLSITVR